MEEKPAMPKLWLCLLLDAAGAATYLVPGLGEWADALWAPLSAYLFLRCFGGKTGQVGAFINLLEEALPFTDLLPTFTIAYFYEKHKRQTLTEKSEKK